MQSLFTVLLFFFSFVEWGRRIKGMIQNNKMIQMHKDLDQLNKGYFTICFCLIATMMNKHDKLDDTSLSVLSFVACAFFWVAEKNFRIMQLNESRKHCKFFMLMCLNGCATELGVCVCVNEKQRKCRLNSLNGNCQHSGWHSAPSEIYANFRHDLLHVQTKQLHFRPLWFGSWRHFWPHFLRFLLQTIRNPRKI